MFRRLWRSATGSDEQQQQHSAKNGPHLNGHSAAATASQTHADNQAAAATLHNNQPQAASNHNASANSSTPSAASSAALPNHSFAASNTSAAGAASHSQSTASPSPLSSSAPPTPLVISESAVRAPASTSFPVGEKFYGLENSNNVCYANSVLQALYACRPFRQQLLVYYEENNKKRKPDDTLLLSLATLYYRIQTSKKARGVVSPAHFIKKLKKSNEQFDSTAHQDAQEFLIFLLNDISDTIKAEKDKAAKDKLAAQQQLSGGGAGGVPHVAKKSAFSSLFSQSSSAPSSPAPSHHSLFSSNANSSSSHSSAASSSSHSTAHTNANHTADGVSDQLPNLSAVSAATAAGSKPNTDTLGTHEQQQHSAVTAQPSSTASASSTTASNSVSSAATTDGTVSLTSHSSTTADPHPSLSAQPSSSMSSATAHSTASSSSAASASAFAPPSVSWVQSLFEGSLTNLTSCLRCGVVSERDESFLDLSVDLLEHHSLSSCLRSFSHDEMLSGADKYLCDACGCRQEAVKSLRIKSTPSILILHMKRFKYQEAIRTFAKLTYRVTFPLSLRLLQPNASTATTAADCGLYSLTAVVVHIGNGARSGHYVCMCRGSSGQFYLYDDTSITAIGESELQATFGSEMGGSHQDGYLLFYEREQPNTQQIAMHTKAQQPVGSSSTAARVNETLLKAANGAAVQANSAVAAETASGISVAG